MKQLFIFSAVTVLFIACKKDPDPVYRTLQLKYETELNESNVDVITENSGIHISTGPQGYHFSLKRVQTGTKVEFSVSSEDTGYVQFQLMEGTRLLGSVYDTLHTGQAQISGSFMVE